MIGNPTTAAAWRNMLERRRKRGQPMGPVRVTVTTGADVRRAKRERLERLLKGMR